ncbi:MAG: FeoB-associated Cys-rich membrane protein [Anaerovoracaceae bacterium]|nr:FeoB-associated Cys-rich membrane protein [Anaerovoracaceae bacterium]
MLGNIVVILILAAWAVWALRSIVGEAKNGGCAGCTGGGCGGSCSGSACSGSALDDLNKLADRLAAERSNREKR